MSFREPPQAKNQLMAGLATFFGAKENIPLTPFVHDWQEMELGQYVSRKTGAGEKVRVENEVNAIKQGAREQNELFLQKRLALVKRVRIIAMILFGLILCVTFIWSFYSQIQK